MYGAEGEGDTTADGVHVYRRCMADAASRRRDGMEEQEVLAGAVDMDRLTARADLERFVAELSWVDYTVQGTRVWTAHCCRFLPVAAVRAVVAKLLLQRHAVAQPDQRTALAQRSRTCREAAKLATLVGTRSSVRA